MLLVERAHQLDGLVEPGAGDAARSRGAAAQRVHRLQRGREAHPVQRLRLGQLRTVTLLRYGVRSVALQDVEAATVETEVARASAEPPVEVGVVALRLLPSGGDQGHGSVDAEPRQLVAQ